MIDKPLSSFYFVNFYVTEAIKAAMTWRIKAPLWAAVKGCDATEGEQCYI